MRRRTSDQRRGDAAPAAGSRATLRPKRQLTLPEAVCEALGVKPGDELSLDVSDGTLIIRPGRKAALDALEQLRQGFAESGVSLDELLKESKRVRDELFHERYGHLVEKRKAARGRRTRKARAGRA